MIKDIMINSSDLSQIQEQATGDSFWNGVLKMKDRSGNEKHLVVSAGQVTDSINNDQMYVIYGKDITKYA